MGGFLEGSPIVRDVQPTARAAVTSGVGQFAKPATEALSLPGERTAASQDGLVRGEKYELASGCSGQCLQQLLEQRAQPTASVETSTHLADWVALLSMKAPGHQAVPARGRGFLRSVPKSGARQT